MNNKKNKEIIIINLIQLNLKDLKVLKVTKNLEIIIINLIHLKSSKVKLVILTEIESILIKQIIYNNKEEFGFLNKFFDNN